MNEMHEAILRLAQVEAAVGLKRTAICDLEKSGRFPRRIQISARAIGWLRSDIDKFIEERVRASRQLAA